MVMIVPVAIGAPAVAVFIPPAMAVFPTPGACFRQFVAVLRGLRAVPAMALGGFMEFVVHANDPPLAVVVRAQWGGAGEEKRDAQS